MGVAVENAIRELVPSGDGSIRHLRRAAGQLLMLAQLNGKEQTSPASPQLLY